MGRSRSVAVGEGVRLEHVLTRKLLRVVGLGQVVEFPVHVLDELGVKTGAERQFLLFGGEKTRGGMRDLVGVFRTEDQAKVAFRELRERTVDGWGEVVRLDAHGEVSQRCWFDDARDAGGARRPAAVGNRWWRRP
jgi:hypothetical protein